MPTCKRLDAQIQLLHRLRSLALFFLAIWGLALLHAGQVQADQLSLAKTRSIDGPEALMAALTMAEGGETLLLAGGHYGSLILTPYIGISVDFADIVTIESADPSDPAVFSGLLLNQVTNLTIQSVVFEYSFTQGDVPNTRNFVVDESRNVTIRNSLFDGDIARSVSAFDDGRGMATGLSTTASENVVVSGNEFRRFNRAVFVNRGRDVQIVGNDMHSQRSEGMNITASSRVTIEDNHIHSFDRSFKSGDHADMIQFWTNGTDQPSQDIVIRRNLLSSASRGYTQSIFIFNEEVVFGRAGREMFYRNFLIEDNVIFNAHLHGITVGDVVGLRILNNTLIHDRLSDGHVENPTLWRPRINVNAASDDVEIRGNVTSAIVGPEQRSDWRVLDTILAQDMQPTRSDWYGNVFTDAFAGDTGQPETFVYAPNGPIDGRRIGSALLRFDHRDADGRIDIARAPETRPVRPFVRIETGLDDLGRLTNEFRAVPANVGPDPVTFSWTVDGVTQNGETLRHLFDAPGYYPVTLAVQAMPDRRIVAETTIWVEIPEERFLTFDPAQNAIFAWQTDEVKLVEGLAIARNGEIQISPDAHLNLPARLFAPLAGANKMRLFLRFRADLEMREPAGDILHLMDVLSVTLTPAGAIDVNVRSEDGAVNLSTQPLRLIDGAWHDLELVWDVAEDSATLFINGDLRATTSLNGRAVSGLATPRATLGHPGGGSTFSGALSRFDFYAVTRE